MSLVRRFCTSRALATSFGNLKSKEVISKETSESLAQVFTQVMSNPEGASQEPKGTKYDAAFVMSKDSMVPSKSTPFIKTTPSAVKLPVTSISKEAREMMRPTLDYMDSITTDWELFKFVEPKILELDKRVTRTKKVKKERERSKILEEIKSKCALTPNKPPVTQHTMPIIVERGIQALSEKFQSPESALALFHAAKQQSLKTYVYVCTVGVYNEVFRCHWKYYKSIGAVLELINEMKVNGIQGTYDTHDILQKVLADADKMLNISADGVQFATDTDGSEWTPMWNQEDADDYDSVVQYCVDLHRVVTEDLGSKLRRQRGLL